MNDFFFWLFYKYAVPQIEEDSFPVAYQEEKRRWLEAIEQLPRKGRLQSMDMMTHVKDEWGARSFAMGIHLGMMMVEDFKEIEDDPSEFSPRFRSCGSIGSLSEGAVAAEGGD